MRRNLFRRSETICAATIRTIWGKNQLQLKTGQRLLVRARCLLLAVMRFQARGTDAHGCRIILQGPRLARMLTACLCNVDEQTQKNAALKATSYRDGSCKHIHARAPRPIRCTC